jgi:tetratricopeptide (TPR) repeat protein
MRLGLLALLPLLAGQAGDVEIGASLNRQVARVGETVLLTVTIRAPGVYSPEIEDPRLTGFEVLATADRSTFRFTSVGALREFTREYTLRVQRPGPLTIPPITITVDGTLYESEALRLTVEDQSLGADVPLGLNPRPEEEVAVRLWFEPDTAYVGQQVTLTVAAFFDPSVRSRLQRQPEYRAPDVQGVWTADLPGTQRPERHIVDRREYFVQVYRRAIFPLSPGIVRVPPAAVIYEVRRGLIYAPETFQVESSPAAIVVRPWPSEGVPEGFSGAVGRYDTEIWFDRSDLRAGEAVNLVLEVEGTGNLNALARPPLPEIPGVRVYEGGEDAELQMRGSEFAGHKRFSWVLVPERPGQYVLPTLRFPYFDPQAASYRVARTEPVSLLVQSAAAAALSGDASGGVPIRFIKDQPAAQPLALHGEPAFWGAVAVPLLVALGLLVLGRLGAHRPARPTAPRLQARGRALRGLRALAEAGDAAFFTELRAAVLAWLCARLRSPELAGRGLAQMQHSLEDAGVPPKVALDVIDLLEECARKRYSQRPPDRAAARDLLQRAERLLALVDREAISERRLRAAAGRGAALSLLLLVSGALAGPLAAQPGSTEPAARWFESGVAAYSRGDYSQAAELFDQVRSVRPRDPNVLYNLGNSYYELDERGKAVAYWIRSLRLRPRDRDARYNLRTAVGDDPVVGGALPPLPVSFGELAMIFAALWFGGFLAILAWRRWRRGHLVLIGVAALTLASLCAVLIFFPKSDYAIIAGADSVLRAGPVRQSEIVSAPPPGTGYVVREARGDWLQVTRGNDVEGWIERDRVELID